MTNLERINEVVIAIDNVKTRAKKATGYEMEKLVGDLFALENCLVTEVKLMLQDTWEPSRKIERPKAS